MGVGDRDVDLAEPLPGAERSGLDRAVQVRDGHDRRKVAVDLLEDGLDDYNAACASTRHHLDAAGAYFPPEHVTLFLETFARIAEAYRAAARELREPAP